VLEFAVSPLLKNGQYFKNLDSLMEKNFIAIFEEKKEKKRRENIKMFGKIH
jgi:hypothetical protein